MKKSIVAAAVVAAAGMSGAAASEVFAAENTEIVTQGDPDVIAETSGDPALGSGQKSKEGSLTDGTSAQDSQGKDEGSEAGSEAGDKGSADQTNPETQNKTEEDSSGVKEEKPDQVLKGDLSEDNKTLNPDTLLQTGNPTLNPETTVTENQPLKTPQTQVNGWSEDKYYQDGKALTGINNIKGKLYYFDQDGNLIKGQSKYTDKDGKEQYVCSDLTDGYLFTGFFDLGGKYETVNPGKVYYDPTSGFMHFGFLTLDSNTYYFDEKSGRMVRGQYETEPSVWRYFDLKTGVMAESKFVDLRLSDGSAGDMDKTVYYDENGVMVRGIKEINGSKYGFTKSNGAMIRGQYETEPNVWRYFDLKTGVMAESKFVDLRLSDGSAGDMDKTVYYDENGVMSRGQKEINGKWYGFSLSNGAMFTGMTYLNSSYAPDGPKTVYYATKKDADEDHPVGSMIKGFYLIEGKQYCFDKNTGARAENMLMEQTVNGKKGQQYYGRDGALVKGQYETSPNVWRYFDLKTGLMAVSEFVDLRLADGSAGDMDKTVYYDENGVMVRGIKEINGSKYGFTKSNGAMIRGQYETEPNVWRYFDLKTGVMAESKFVDLRLADGSAGDMDKTVYYDENGVMVRGLKDINSHRYGFSISNGAMFTGRTELSGSYQPGGPMAVLFNDAETIEKGRGQMLFGHQEIGSKIFYADPNTGALKDNYRYTGEDGKTYFYSTYGDAKRNSQINYEGGWYFVGDDGQFITNTLKTLTKEQNDGEAKTVYYGQDGKMIYGFAHVGGAWRYFKFTDGSMAQNELLHINEDKNGLNHRTGDFLFNNDGVLLMSGEYVLDGTKYVIDSDTYEAAATYPSWLQIINGVVHFRQYGHDITAPVNSKLGQLLLSASTHWDASFKSGGRNNDERLDCIGFVMRTFNKAFDLNLQANSVNDFVTARNYGYWIPESALRPGDIVTYRGTWTTNLNWYTHSSIYLGNGLVMYISYGGTVIGPMRGIANQYGYEAARQAIRIDIPGYM